jgi:hypothetical protein
VSADRSGAPAPEGGPTKRHNLIVAGAVMFVVLTFAEVLSWIEHGGISSIISAVIAADAKAPVVAIDRNWLRFPVWIVLFLVTIGICRLLDIDLLKRWRLSLAFVVIMGGGFILPAIYGESVTTRYMAGQGYGRCPSRDHVVGHGKGRVWFVDYVLASGNCARASFEGRQPIAG